MKSFFKSKKHPWWICSVPGDCAMVWRGQYGIINFARARFFLGKWIMEYSGPMVDAPKKKSVQENIKPVKGAPCLIDPNNNVPIYNGEWPGLVDYLKKRLDINLKRRPGASTLKGKVGEREVANIYREWAGDPKSVERNLDQHKNGGGDLIGPGLNGWYVEVKRTRRNLLSKWKRQCNKGAPDPSTPVAVWWRADSEEWKIYVRINGEWNDNPLRLADDGAKEFLTK